MNSQNKKDEYNADGTKKTEKEKQKEVDFKKQAEKINEENYNWKKNFDIYKEENRQKDILIQNLLSEQNTRASIIPYFNVVLKDNRIKKEENSLILEIGFMNIGKESATNIQLSPKFPDKGLQGYIYSEGYPKKLYYIYEYLSQYYAAAREEVTFKIKVDLKNGEKINDFLKFKIKYYYSKICNSPFKK